MLDIARFAQDGVGVKTKQYELSIVSGSGTFEANGKIVFAVGTARGEGTQDNIFFGTVYLYPNTSTSSSALLYSPFSPRVFLTYVDEKTITYSTGSTSSAFAFISEKA